MFAFFAHSASAHTESQVACTFFQKEKVPEVTDLWDSRQIVTDLQIRIKIYLWILTVCLYKKSSRGYCNIDSSRNKTEAACFNHWVSIRPHTAVFSLPSGERTAFALHHFALWYEVNDVLAWLPFLSDSVQTVWFFFLFFFQCIMCKKKTTTLKWGCKIQDVPCKLSV